MSSLYLIRHGQAGLRHHYDTLSALGCRQAGLLGEYLAAQGVRFTAVYAGALERQQKTAERVRQAYLQAGIAIPEIQTDPSWNEFDLDQVYRDMAPPLSAEDPEFRAAYQEMRRQARDMSSPVHRQWSSCDTAMVRSWIEARYPCHGESWAEFQARVVGGMDALSAYGSGESVAVFTSATPISVWIGTALEVPDGRVLRLAGAMYNSAVSTLRLRGRDLALFSFNNAAHLPPDLRTFR